jgi:hypothetical protein
MNQRRILPANSRSIKNIPASLVGRISETILYQVDMSDTLINDSKKTDKFKRQKKFRLNELDECRSWLEGLGFQSAPKMHVNGIAHPSAVVVVDFGTPLNEPTKLTAEQSAELIGHIRSNTKALYREREVTVRVQSDTSTGIWWSSVG